MTKTPETNIIFDPNAKFEMPEHTGGDGWTILHGDCLRLMREMQDGELSEEELLLLGLL